MKLKLSYLVMAAGVLLLSNCGAGPTLGNKDASRDDLIPVPVDASQTDVYKQNPDLPVINVQKDAIYDAAGNPISMRGINVRKSGESASSMEDGVVAVYSTGSNVVRLLVNTTTTATQLKNALNKAVDGNLIAIVSLSDASLQCKDDAVALNDAVKKLWLNDWIAVLSAEKFQSHLMINIADGWGPAGAYYLDYLEEYKTQIQRFRAAGFKSPLVIDAPNCGKNYRALVAVAKTLVDSDPAHNIVLSVQPDGDSWNSDDKLVTGFSQLDNLDIPYIVNSLNGSGVGGKAAVNHQSVMTKAMGDHAVQLNLPWVSTTDSVAYSTKLAKATNLKGGSVVSINTFIDKDYLQMVKQTNGVLLVPSGKTTIALYLKDGNGNRLQVSQTQAEDLPATFWKNITSVVPADNDLIDPANLMNGATTFDLASVTEVGVRVLANGKPVDVVGKIKFDDLRISEGVLPVHSASFSTDTGSWFAKNATATLVDGTWSLLPTGVTGPSKDDPAKLDGYKLEIELGDVRKSLDFSKELVLKMRIFVPVEYAADLAGAYMAAYGMPEDAWNWQGFQISTSSIKAGEWSEVKVTLNVKESPTHPGSIKNTHLGIQLGMNADTPRTQPILIDSIEIIDPSAKKLKPVTGSQFTYKFLSDTEGFVPREEGSDGWKGVTPTKLTVANGEMTITPTASTGTSYTVDNRDINKITEINFSGPSSIKAKVFIPANYTATANEFGMHIFMMDTNWCWFQTPNIKIENFTLGAWTDVVITPDLKDHKCEGKAFKTDLPPNAFGVVFDGTDGLNGGAIKIKDIEFVGTTYVDDSTPALLVDFSSQTDVDNFAFDFAGGSFTESTLVSAKTLDYKVRPFGWLAAPLLGNEVSALDLITDLKITPVDAKTFTISYFFTARGDEIINGLLGIRKTSQLATFPPVPGLPVSTN